MAVPTIPSAISLAAIQTEFGGANPISISEYYRGGAYVGSSTANATGTLIPASGTISFANFSGAVAALPEMGWWYQILQPNTALQSTADLNGTTIRYMQGAANGNTIIFAKNSPGTEFIQRVNTSTGVVSWAVEPSITIGTVGGSVAPNGDFYRFGYLGLNRILYKVNGAGTHQWSVQTTNLINSIVATDHGLWALGRGASSNGGWLVRLSAANGITQEYKRGFSGTVTNWGLQYLYTNHNRTLIYVASSAGTAMRLISLWSANGVLRYSRSASIIFGALRNDSDCITDTANNIYAAGNGTVSNRVVKISDAGTFGYCFEYPGTVTSFCNDVGGNTYFAYTEGTANTVLIKLNSAGTHQWARRIRNTRSPAPYGMIAASVIRLEATPTELMVMVQSYPRSYDTKWGSWVNYAQIESHILRVSTSAPPTGAIANLNFLSISAPSRTQTFPTTSANTASNIAYTFSFTANVLTTSANTSKALSPTFL